MSAAALNPQSCNCRSNRKVPGDRKSPPSHSRSSDPRMQLPDLLYMYESGSTRYSHFSEYNYQSFSQLLGKVLMLYRARRLRNFLFPCLG